MVARTGMALRQEKDGRSQPECAASAVVDDERDRDVW